MKQFDYYEFTAILVPGAAFLIGLGVIFPDAFGAKYLQGVSLGDLGIFTIAAYVFGHIVQAFGNFYETLLWFACKDRPTDWILKDQNTLLSREQTKKVKEKISTELGEVIHGTTKTLMPLTRQVYTRLKAKQLTARVDIFNANYGLNRALASSFFAATILATLALSPHHWTIAGVFLFLAALLTYRMYDFGRCYARELYLEFIN
jgi:hypothetical protein